ncbi:MAG TPA: xanthine dehydrogenase family protein subunit M [Chloroflexota bacterium]|nr:xanthine dehydrogenase family protein subunit M [Chloroflexota bacterium]
MSIQFYQPRTLQEAVGLLSSHAPGARPLAGGTDLVVHTRQGRGPLPETLVHLGAIPGLNAIAVDDSGVLHIGAMASHGDIERSAVVQKNWAALSDASAIVGSPATRHVGTIGGNLCNGSPAMEVGGPLLAFDATVRLLGPRGERSLPLAQFFVGPGSTAREQDELLVEVVVPPVTGPHGSAYLRLEFRKAMEIAIVGATAVVQRTQQGTIGDCRIALTAVAPTIVRVAEAEQALRGTTGNADDLARAGELAAAASAPIDDVRAPAWYRRDMVKVLTVRALRRALERAGTGKEPAVETAG